MEEYKVDNLIRVVCDESDELFYKAMTEEYAPLDEEDCRQEIWLKNMFYNCVIHLYLSGKNTRYLMNTLFNAIEIAIDLDQEEDEEDDS